MFNNQSFIEAVREGREDDAFEMAGNEQFNIREAYMFTENPEQADIHTWIRDNLLDLEDETPLAPSSGPKRVITEEDLETPSLRDILVAALHARR